MTDSFEEILKANGFTDFPVLTKEQGRTIFLRIKQVNNEARQRVYDTMDALAEELSNQYGIPLDIAKAVVDRISKVLILLEMQE